MGHDDGTDASTHDSIEGTSGLRIHVGSHGVFASTYVGIHGGIHGGTHGIHTGIHGGSHVGAHDAIHRLGTYGGIHGLGSRVHDSTDASIDDRADLSIVSTDAGIDGKIDATVVSVSAHAFAYNATYARVAHAGHAHHHPRVSSGRVSRRSAQSV